MPYLQSSRVTIPCSNCGKPLKRFPNEVNKACYCNQRCQQEKLYPKKNKSCKLCHRSFIGKGSFCCPEHRTEFNSELAKRTLAKRYPPKEYTCNFCQKKFISTKKKKYCCAEHAKAGFKVARKISKESKRIKRTCLGCPTTFVVSAGSTKKYCCPSCWWKTRKPLVQREHHPKWKGGKAKDYGPDWGSIAKKVRTRDENKCRVCDSVKGPGRNLPVHHIKPLREFNNDFVEANKESNLITLCVSCHNKVESGIIFIDLTPVSLPLLFG